MAESDSLDRRAVRIFFSADLTGSTAFKQRQSPPVGHKIKPWLKVFEVFYGDFLSEFRRAIDGDHAIASEPEPRILKAIGDEVVLYAEVRKSACLQPMVKAFRKALTEYGNKLRADDGLGQGLGIKGACWLAGFPINNKAIPLRHAASSGIDFIGPSMDTGFRVSKAATEERIAITVDLALVLLAYQCPDVRFGGAHPLKGVLGGMPYPVFYLLMDRPVARLYDKMEQVLVGRVGDVGKLEDFCREYIEVMKDTWLCVPYFDGDDSFSEPPEWHKEQIELVERSRKEEAEVGDDRPESGAQDGSGEMRVLNLREKLGMPPRSEPT